MQAEATRTALRLSTSRPSPALPLPHPCQPHPRALPPHGTRPVPQEFGESLPSLAGLWVPPPPSGARKGRACDVVLEAEASDPLERGPAAEDVDREFYLPAHALTPKEGDAELEALFAGLTVRPPKLTPVADGPLPADLLADAEARRERLSAGV